MSAALASPVGPDTGRVPLFAAPPRPSCSAPPIPDGPCPVCPRLAQEFEPWRQAGYWKAMHDRALQREARLQQEVEQLRAQLRLREQPRFGRKTETTAATTPTRTSTSRDAPPRRWRGQQRGQKGPRRRDYSHWPAVVEEHAIPGGPCCGRCCGRPFAPVSGTADSTLLEVEVQAHRRLILVFATVEGKVGFRWYLWAFHADAVVVFVRAQGRSHGVPEDYLGPDAAGIMVVDRDQAYPVIDQVKRGLIVRAFCWAPVRRDFVTVARTWSDQEGWALAWVERIGTLYQRNGARRAVQEEPATFAVADARLRAAVASLGQHGEAALLDPSLHPARRKVLESWGNHGTGLTVFVEHPDVPRDNNPAERAERGPVVGRKNYYGSGAVWAGRLAALLFALVQTLCLGKLNPRSWLTAYLTACAESGGAAPENGARFLPWNLSEEDRRNWSLGGTDDGPDPA